MLIKVKPHSGGEFELTVEPSYTIKRVKEEIEEKKGIPPEQQQLYFNGRQLANNETLADYKVSGGSVLNLVLLARGG